MNAITISGMNDVDTEDDVSANAGNFTNAGVGGSDIADNDVSSDDNVNLTLRCQSYIRCQFIHSTSKIMGFSCCF